MAELREREHAVLQGQVWATGSNNLGGSQIQRRDDGINGPGLQGGAKAALPVRNAKRGLNPLFFDDLRLEYPSILEAILRFTINISLHPISIMKLSTEFSEGNTDTAVDKGFDSVDIRGVNHLLRCFIIYCSILCLLSIGENR